MARSHASAHHSGQQGQAEWPSQEVDAFGRPIDPSLNGGPQAPAQQQGHPGYAPGSHGGYGYAPNQGYPAQGYAQPSAPHGYPQQPDYVAAGHHGAADPYGQHPGYSADPRQQGPHNLSQPYYPAGSGQPVAPSHFEHYQPQAPQALPGFDRYGGPAGPENHGQHGDPGYAPGQYQHQPAPVSMPHDYSSQQHPQHQPHLYEQSFLDPSGQAAPGHPGSDPRSWDLGHYQPMGGPAGQDGQVNYSAELQHGQADPRFVDPAAQQASAWYQQQAAAGPYPAQPNHPYGGQQYDPSLGGHRGMAGDPSLSFDPAHEHQDGPVDEAEEEEPRRGPRPMIVAAALVLAIAVGGGLAFGYKKLMGDGGKVATPTVKADRSPIREKPKDPGGKQQPHTDKKFPNRLDEKAAPVTAEPPAPAPAPAETEGGPRRVTTVIVNKDGTITPTAPPAPAGPPPPLPGMVVQNVPQPELRGPAQPERPVAPAPVQRVPPAQPKVADLPLPKVKVEPKAPVAANPPPPARKKPQVRDDLLAQQPAAPAPAAKAPSGTAGYVAVLVSRRSREDALKEFADLHQKFPDILAGRAPDVREKNFGDAATGPKGLWYRLIVGPPGSKEASQELCQKLAAQGFKGCFSMAY